MTQAPRVFVFSHPRTASHVFFQMLATHPVFQVVLPFCCAAAYVVGTEAQEARSREEWRDLLAMSEDDASRVTWQGCIDNLQKGVAEAELAGKWALTMDHPHYLIASATIKAHGITSGRASKPVPIVEDRKMDVSSAYSPLDIELIASLPHPNPTLLPPRFFFSFTPIITVRHPARVIPSYLRAFQRLGDDLSHPDFPIAAESFRLERLVFDSFRSFEEVRAGAEGRKPKAPVVIDGDRLIRDPRGQMEKLCEVLGIDGSHLKYSWDPPNVAEHTKLGRAFRDEFSRSTGVFANPRANKVSMEEEVKAWVQEWDEHIARILEAKVEAQMEDYQYLLHFAL